MYSWNKFKNFPRIKDLPTHEQNRQYRIYESNAIYESKPLSVSSGGHGNKFVIISNNIQWNYIGNQITQNGSIGFINTGSDNIVDSYVNYVVLNGFNVVLDNYWTNNGLAADNSAYIFNVDWGPGSSISNGKVRMSFYNGDDYGNPGYYTINVSPVDTSNDSWMDPNANPQSLGGTFNFPATFNIYSPTILSMNQSWC